MARDINISGLGGTQITIAPGSTNAVYILPEPQELSSSFNWLSGGSIMIFAVPKDTNYQLFNQGQTWLGPSLVVIGNSAMGYLLSTTATYNVQGAAHYYAMAVGSTAILAKMVGYSQN